MHDHADWGDPLLDIYHSSDETGALTPQELEMYRNVMRAKQKLRQSPAEYRLSPRVRV